MEHFSNYLVLALSVGLLTSVFSLLSHTAYKAETNMALGILSLALLILPVFGLVGSGISFPEFDSVPAAIGGDFGEALLEPFSQGIERYIAEEFSVSREDVTVSVYGLLPEKMRAERITVTLRGSGVLIDTAALRRIVAENFTDMGDCEVKLEFG